MRHSAQHAHFPEQHSVCSCMPVNDATIRELSSATLWGPKRSCRGLSAGRFTLLTSKLVLALTSSYSSRYRV